MRFEPLTTRASLSLLIVCALSLLALPQTSPLASLVETERAFARASVELGVRNSFLAFFADDAINFWPHPLNAREALLKQPAPSERPTTTLNWEPALADVSGAGDLGYTTGPTLTTDDKQKPIRSGYYFSIWRRQSDGNWKVELDIGVKTPPTNSLPPQSLRTPTQFARGNNRRSAGEGQNVLMNLERKFPTSTNVIEAFLKLITDDAQLNYDGYFPAVGRKEIRAFLAERRFTPKWEPIRAVVSSSNDFAYTYGKYVWKETTQPQSVVKTGYYVHVWRRDAKDRWNLAVEVSAAPLSG